MPETITITLPVAKPGGGYHSDRLDCRLTPQQSEALAHVTSGLDAANSRLANGRRIINNPDVIRYICEQISAQVEETNVAA